MKYFPTYDEDNHLWGLVILPRFRKKKKKTHQPSEKVLLITECLICPIIILPLKNTQIHSSRAFVPSRACEKSENLILIRWRGRDLQSECCPFRKNRRNYTASVRTTKIKMA